LVLFVTNAEITIQWLWRQTTARAIDLGFWFTIVGVDK
jgi:hypothetical protein